MDEQDFRASLRDALDHAAAPPTMSVQAAVHTGRKAARRRTFAATGTGGAVLAIVTTIGLTAAYGGSGASQTVGTPGADRTSTPGSGDSTKSARPTGPSGGPQAGGTATATTKADSAKALLAHLVSVVPAGYTAPDEPETTTTDASRHSLAEPSDKIGGKDLWLYLASIRIEQNGAAGRLIVEVHEPGLTKGATPCDVAKHFWAKPTACAVIQVGGRDVAVSTGGGDPQDDRIDKWATYAHPDGTVVFFAESKRGNFRPHSTDARLTALPLTDQQLAALAVDEGFHVKH